jgi:hypothetical protein
MSSVIRRALQLFALSLLSFPVVSLRPIYGQPSQLSLTGVNEGAQILLSPTAVTNLTVTAKSASAAAIQSIEFLLERRGTVVQRLTSVPPHVVTFTNLSAGKYFLAAAATWPGGPVATADLSFDIRLPSLQPVNDPWSQAAVVPGLGVVMTNSTVNATRETNEPPHSRSGGGRSLWWTWRAATNGAVTVTTSGSSFDTVLAIYTGTSLGALRPVAANDDVGLRSFSQASFNAIAGTNYYFAVDGALTPAGTTASGEVQLRVVPGSPPAIGLLSPKNGAALFVASPNSPTNLTVSATITDNAGLDRVEYRLEGGGIQRMGSSVPPYQWSLTNLTAGDYVLTITAVNRQELTTVAHHGFSVISVAPRILLVRTPPAAPWGFELIVTGWKGMNYALQTSTNLAVWSPSVVWTNFSGVESAIETNLTQFGARFYRVVAK